MLSSVLETCVPRPEILAGDLSLDLFAAKLRLVVEGNAPQTYQQPEKFFANTFETNGLKCLIEEVFGRLTGMDVGSPVIRLETSFGGGKTHDELALWHIAKKGREIEGLDRFVDNLEKIPAFPIQLAAVDGRDIDPESGTYHQETGITTYTLWGEIAYQIGGIEGYQLLRGSDEKGISPGTSVLERLITDQPTLIILDEVARYLRAAKAKVIGQSTLSEQVVAFLFSLMDLAASCNNLVFVYSLASASDTFAQETEDIRDKLAQDIFSAPSDSAPESTDLQELRRASARQERILSPSSDVEVYNIVKQRMFSSISEQAAQRAADEYLGAYRASRVDLPDGCKDASYGQAIAQSYPFHPELFNLLTKKIASIPEFQRTRGALRLFARVVRYLWQEQGGHQPQAPRLPMTMVHAHYLPIGVEQEITSDLTSRLQRPLMDLPIKADIHNRDGREAHAQVQDQEWLAAAKPPFSSWVSRTIFLHSLTQGISSGLRRSELNLSLLMPNVEIGFVDRALDRLTKVAWYLDLDPITTIARFKEEPSINKIIAEEKEQIGLTEAKDELRKRRDSIFASKFFDRISGPEGSHEVDDRSDTIALCLIDFNEATLNASTDGTPPLVEQIFNNTGESGRFRTFRNRLLFLLANKQELDRAIDLTREYKAVQSILHSPNRLDDLSESQQKDLKKKEGKLDLDVRIALTNAYRHLFYPSQDPIKAPKGLMHYPLPAQDCSTIKSNQQDVILKALKDCSKIRPEEAQPFAPAYILQKVWPSGLDQWTTKALREAFAKDLNLNILLDAELSKLRDTIRQGLLDGQWDLKMGNQTFIKTTVQPLTLPGTIEFSERMELYRRGILKPPEPKDIELSAQVLPSGGIEQVVRVRWRAKGAVSVSLYQGNDLLGDQFKPSDEYEGKITTTTSFRVVADYGAEGTEEKVTTAGVYGSDTPATSSVKDTIATPILIKPTELNLQGSPTKVFNDLADQVNDHQVKSITVLEISVEQIMDYRKLCTTIPLLQRFQPQIEQYVRIQTGQQFVSLEYQGDLRGFQSFTTPLNGLLNHPEVQGSTMLKVRFEFEEPIATTGSPLTEIQGALQRNPVERLDLFLRVGY